jgi:hypothetical protein
MCSAKEVSVMESYDLSVWPGSARQIYGSILLQTAENKSTQARRQFIIKLIF